MVKNKLIFFALAISLACTSLQAAESVGKVLALQGAAVTVRGAQEIPLQRGAQVEIGDLLRVAERSSLQVRFSDESVVALRANTEFKIEDYKLTATGEGDKSLFSLVKGGLRTITGMIGKRNPEAYQLRTSSATIGIRGTNFAAVTCASDCSNADGSKAEDGLYGSVTGGRIVVRNQAGETEFSRDQYFMVASQNAPAKSLLAPPGFLRDKLDGMAKTRGSAPAKTVEAQVADNSGSTSTAETLSPAPIVVGANPATAPASPLVAADMPAIQPSATSAGFSVAQASAATRTHSDAGGAIAVFPGSQGFAWQIAAIKAASFDGVPITGITSLTDFLKSANSFTFSEASASGSVTKSASSEVGFSAEAGNVSWGRFSKTDSMYYSDGSSDTWVEMEHWAVGDAVTSMPTSGIFTYTGVGGTSPTDSSGAVGTMSSRGEWTLNFGARTIQTSLPIAWSMPNTATYSVSVPVQSFSVSAGPMDDIFGATSRIANASGLNFTSTTTCGGPCISAASKVYVTAFGAQAEGLGVSVITQGAISAGITQNMGSVQVYKR